VDRDRSGDIDVIEFVEWLFAKPKGPKVKKSEKFTDPSVKGYLTLEEIKKAIRQHSEELTATIGWDAMFQKYDKNGDGVLNEVEFREMIVIGQSANDER
jgi:Ca2+-binding EF-hand superfamily protein